MGWGREGRGGEGNEGEGGEGREGEYRHFFLYTLSTATDWRVKTVVII